MRNEENIMKKHIILTIIITTLLCINITGCNEQNNTTPIDTDGDGYNDNIDAFPNNAKTQTMTASAITPIITQMMIHDGKHHKHLH